MSGARGLVLDYGGVLTLPLGESFRAFEAEIDVPPGRCVSLLIRASRIPGGGPIGALERGEISVAAFEERLRELLNEEGHQVPDVPLVEGLFRRARPAGRLWDVASAARRSGRRTGLLSNSWGSSLYPFERLEAVFDTVVISADVGMRKPEARIYELTVERLGIPAEDIVFVDDLPRNVEVARELGMRAVHHDGDDAAVADRVTIELGLSSG